MTNRDLLIRDGYVRFDSVVPEDLRLRAIASINSFEEECPVWKTPETYEFRAWYRNFLNNTAQMELHGEADFSVFNRPVGGWMYWHDDEEGRPYRTDLPYRRVFACAYLTDTYGGRGALKIIPNSHRAGYEDMKESVRLMRLQVSHIPPYQNYAGNPYLEHPLLWRHHDEEMLVEVPAGSVVIVDERMLHGTDENRGPDRRTMILWWQLKCKEDKLKAGG